MKRNVVMGWTSVAAMLCLGQGAVGCGGPENFDPEKPAVSQTKKESPEKADAWGANDNPSIFNSTLVYKYSALPDVGEVTNIPWAASYWPVYEDSINYKWDGSSSESAPKKFERAFGLTGVEDAVSKFHGIDSQSSRKECKETTECSDLKDGSQCAKRPGAEKGRCIPTWWGICHGWAPYAFSEPDATKSVVKNGVTFHPGDLYGLMSLMYSRGLTTYRLSERCNTKDPKLGNDGRIAASECRDMNAGAWHVLVANKLGLQKSSFVYDRTYDLEVWNQPVRGFAITNLDGGKLKRVTKAQAIALLGGKVEYKPVLASIDLAKAQEQSGVMTAGAAGTVELRLSGSGDADLYVRRGEAPTDNVFDCRPYDSNSNETCSFDVVAGEKLFWRVVGYADASKVALDLGTQLEATTYPYNSTADDFYHVEMDFQYITEASPSLTSNVPDVDRYTRTDHFAYILEVKDGKIVGGEWVGPSRTRHPDFAWWPAAKPTTNNIYGLTYNMLKALNDEAAGVTGEPVVEERPIAASSVSYASAYFTPSFTPGDKVELVLTADKPVGLYARIGSKPTLTAAGRAKNLCNQEGTTLSCKFTVPAAGASYFVRVKPGTYGEVANFRLKAVVTK